MASPNNLRVGLAKALFYSLLSFFLVPGITYGFVSYAFHKMDADYSVEIQKKIDAATTATPQQKEAFKAFSANFAPSKRCGLNVADEQLQKQAQKACEPYNPLWQFSAVYVAAWWTLVAGAGVFAAIFLLGGVAFLSSRAPALSFLVGWRLLVAASTLEVAVQGAFAVWLSYWLTAYFAKIYVPKIIGVVAIVAISAAVYAIIWIFKKIPMKNEIAGVPLTREQEPKLWARVRALAAKAGTAPPDHIVAGIDANFFVTQAPLTLDGRQLTGRVLYVSLPLLRILDETEADAVLAHELAHFHGGDTKWSSLLGPKLAQFDLYCLVMQLRNVYVALHILRLYRIIFEFALKRGSRRREFIADSAAARIVSGEALVRSLIKFLGYATYRKQVESQLFAHDQRHEGALAIAGQVAAGLGPYAASSQFIDNVRLADIPHPFDSHPSLADRMNNVGYAVEERHYPGIVMLAPAKTWADDIASLGTVEAGLWRRYEENFAAQHEHTLAYRYRPSNAEEEAIVLKYFPPLEFHLRGGKRIVVSYAGITLPALVKDASDGLVPWSQIVSLALKNSTFRGQRLVIGHPKTSALPGLDTTTVSLRGLRNVAAFKDTLAHYWRRHQIMVQSDQRLA